MTHSVELVTTSPERRAGPGFVATTVLVKPHFPFAHRHVGENLKQTAHGQGHVIEFLLRESTPVCLTIRSEFFAQMLRLCVAVETVVRAVDVEQVLIEDRDTVFACSIALVTRTGGEFASVAASMYAIRLVPPCR